MKVLILGGSGMLGHKLWQTLNHDFETYVTLRHDISLYEQFGLFYPAHTFPQVSVEDFDSVSRSVDMVSPDVVVNCIGIVKQSQLAMLPIPCMLVNGLFPHRLAELGVKKRFRLIHISTDCVFSGRKGNYVEDDFSDAEDLYGRTKFLGEVSGENCLTIRTSMIGREIESSRGLIEWFLSQNGKLVNGYARSIFSGLTTNELSRLISVIVGEHPELQGIYHLAAPRISKFDLLELVKRVYQMNVEIIRDDTIVIDRSLNSDRFYRATGLIQPEWHVMIEKMFKDTTRYSDIRRPNVNR